MSAMNYVVDKKSTVQIRIDAGWHKLLQQYAKSTGRSIRDVVEEILADCTYLSQEIN